MKKTILLAVVAIVVGLGAAIAASQGVFASRETADAPKKPSAPVQRGPDDSAADDSAGPGEGMTAIDEAAAANTYLFAFFWKDDSGQTAAMRKVLENAVEKAGDRATSVSIRIADPAEKRIVAKFDLSRAPMPLVLAIAPNGAVMGGFPNKFAEDDLLGAFGTPCTEQCMKALQNNRLVFLCVQNKSTKANGEALRGVQDFKADARYSQATEIVMLDPADRAEASFLAGLKIAPEETEAVTAFLAPPGAVIGEFKGATNKEELIATLQKANTACGPGGCGPGGCGPKQ